MTTKLCSTGLLPELRPASASASTSRRRGRCMAAFAAARIKALTTVLCLLQLAACGGGGAMNERESAAPVAFTTALSGHSSGIATPETVVVRDAEQWTQLWRRHASLMLPPLPAPPLDFGGRQMVGVFIGTRPNGCHAVTVTAVTREPEALVVRYREQRAREDQVCTQALTQPHHLVWVPASSLPVVFRAE